MMSTFEINGLMSGRKLHFENWHPFESSLEYATNENGVYCMRLQEAICRVKGKSDIAYIGSATNGFKTRFRGYMNPGPTQKTNIRVKEFSRKYKLEVSFLVTDKPKFYESLLLEEYLADHDELPPLNHSGIEQFHFKK
ncbi:MAG: hypothetical protein QW346_02935 [Candidatus Micrarchaeaceae archaeon]